MTLRYRHRLEKRLVRAAITGSLVDLNAGRPASFQDVQTWGKGREIEAELIRDLLLGRRTTELDPRGVRLRGAWIRGKLDLNGVDAQVGLMLHACRFEESINLNDAHLPWLALEDHCTLRGLSAERVYVQKALTIGDSRVESQDYDGAVRLTGGQVDGHLSVMGTEIENSTGSALVADELTVKGAVLLDDLQAVGTGPAGSVTLNSAIIYGKLNLRRARLTNDNGPALMAENLTVNRDAFVCENPESDGFEATGTGATGAVSLIGASVTGQLALRGATLTNSTGPALVADNLTVRDLVLDTGFTATGAGPYGAVRIPNSVITGQLTLRGATLTNTTGPALVADNLTVKTDMLLDQTFTATGTDSDGAVQLRGATIDGQLLLQGASLTNRNGPALVADSLTAKSAMLDDGFTAIGAGPDGAVRLLSAAISTQLSLRGATLTNTTGQALVGTNLSCRDLFLDAGFTAMGSGSKGTVSLTGATIPGTLRCSGWVSNPDGLALNLIDVKAGTLSLPSSFARKKHPGPGAATAADGLMEFDGLTYVGLPEPDSDLNQWQSWLRDRTPGYKAQPYRHLASSYQAAGHDTQARRIHVAQNDDLTARGGNRNYGRFRQGLHRFRRLLFKRLVGYGYHPFWALAWFVGLVVITVIACMAWLGPHGLITHPPSKETARSAIGKAPAPQHCSVAESVGYAIDLSFPVIKINASDRCQLTSGGLWPAVFGWVVRAAAAVLAALFLAGVTGIARKP
ncbi:MULTISPECIES: hypothetical protein [unclassified Streptomyces]|uniref:hypothetical protein n=1 Tax=unclassified Streptomyces TaxID=2593676 RepID=UPI001BE8725E|nr:MULTISPECIES: hypothetical protein [unclassified Streptomyces]MBT2406330.1 hypothetical protein [Streptomyces sp. ISL-21]MBT2607376.1 hypothetical protein [Streptomyces sp. ISL-87]